VAPESTARLFSPPTSSSARSRPITPRDGQEVRCSTSQFLIASGWLVNLQDSEAKIPPALFGVSVSDWAICHSSTRVEGNHWREARMQDLLRARSRE
jgi:hypothetical protein